MLEEGDLLTEAIDDEDGNEEVIGHGDLDPHALRGADAGVVEDGDSFCNAQHLRVEGEPVRGAGAEAKIRAEKLGTGVASNTPDDDVVSNDEEMPPEPMQ